MKDFLVLTIALSPMILLGVYSCIRLSRPEKYEKKMDEYLYNTQRKVERLEKRKAQLEAEVLEKYDADKFRQLTIVEFHFTAKKQLLNGDWAKGDTLADEVFTRRLITTKLRKV
jgi:hypothetical protein